MDIDLTGLVLPERVEAASESLDGRGCEFVLEPLERGYGHTLGNSLRRVLLASLRGAAVWGFRIDGVVHEHQTIQGVVEDVHQIIQSLKSLVVKLDDDVEEATLNIEIKKAGPVTASQISTPPSVEVLDSDHHLMTVEEDRDINVELYVNKGRGFVLADQHDIPRGAPVDLVRIDSIYNPVRRANFTVEETRVGQRTDFDRFTLYVETNGSVSPQEAVEYGAELVRRHFEYMLHFGDGGVPVQTPSGVAPVPDRLKDLFSKPIEDLAELSVRSRNSLQKENIRTLGTLVRKTEEEMLSIENFGKKSLKEISEFLGEHGLRFGMKLEENDEGEFFFLEEGDDSPEEDGEA